MLKPLSQTKKAMRDTTVGKSTGAAFEKICKLHDIPYIGGKFTYDAWRKAALTNALGPRGTHQAIFSFLENAFSEYNVTITGVSTTDTGYTSRLTKTSGFVNQTYFGRYVRLSGGDYSTHSGSKLYKVTGPANLTTGTLNGVSATNGHYLDLSPVGTMLFDGAVFNKIESNITATLLPFLVREELSGIQYEEGGWKRKLSSYQCEYQIILLDPAIQAIVPPHYLQTTIQANGSISPTPATPSPFTQDGATYTPGSTIANAATLLGADERPANQDMGGHVQLNEIDHPGHPSKGPHPPYMTGSGAAYPDFASVLSGLLPAGVTARFYYGKTP